MFPCWTPTDRRCAVPLSDEQRARYGKIAQSTIDDLMECESDVMGKPWEETNEEIAEAVALQARRDLIEELIADAVTGEKQVLITIQLVSKEGVASFLAADYFRMWLAEEGN